MSVADDTPFASEAEVAAIGLGLLGRTLPKPGWTHAAHIAAAAWILRARADLLAERDLPDIIRAYNAATGVPNSDTRGYHATVTLASLRAIRAGLAALPAGIALHRAVNRLVASPIGQKRWPLAYWSEGRLYSPAARRAWVEPDLAPLPF